MQLRISPLIIPLAAAAVLTGTYERLLYAYVFISLHELSHLCAALLIGAKGEELAFSPFGAHLTLRSRFMGSFADELILYLSGPLSNAVFAALGMALKNAEVYNINSALLFINLLPVLPLDGGMILRRFLIDRLGAVKAQRVMGGASLFLGVIALVAAVLALVSGKISYSLFVIAVFLIGNAFTAKGLYDPYIMSALAAGVDV